ncbi:bifunctional riboflavin kinase/FAD synthetase [Marinococcus sp. PL1-022]|uniref:bifunctional riboflavin kinase/FAD synthetase n=1 Tax=Marinococcus sp. PL1-022 TaxID=3095363 RepID=UPI0029C2B9F1|nr:bifunctional riboflavin kinase/FAD synthetase [Marinococcus sp. PL1-022]MDX6152507.1 bifunctional riboflavin kinase/FAD synthetase [Marinococcus sp. PL1-022]
MEVHHFVHPHTLTASLSEPKVMALGYFDGVHRGHAEVIEKARQTAEDRGLPLAVMTFHPHPKVVLSKQTEEDMFYLTPLEEKQRILESLGVEKLYIVRFDQDFASLDPQAFVDAYIIDLGVKHAVAGFDFSYGKFGRGTMETLPYHSRDAFTFSTVSPYTEDGEKVSSTWIRRMVEEGEMVKAARLLGRWYTFEGTVVEGEKRGRTIGFPTANIQSEEPYLLPNDGVYAVRALIDGRWYRGMCNIGYKPTFHDERDGPPEIEVHLFEFNGDIYGKTVRIEWRDRLRGEVKFPSLDALVSQLHEDKRSAEQVLQQEIRD